MPSAALINKEDELKKANIGLIGMEVMGTNLALNMESKGYSVAVFNRTALKTETFAKGRAKGKDILPTYTIEDFVSALESPKKIMLMVKAGKPVDTFIEKLVPLLNEGDLIIDGGNSYYKDTMRRNVDLVEKGIFYIGTGVSGGEEGALKGPALMPGGQLEAYALIEELFKDIAAKAADGLPCVSCIGPHGAGHFVKMVHNGIEYGDMQLIGECVWVLKNAFNMNSKEIADIMLEWNGDGDVLRSYLVEITADGMREKYAGTDEYRVDRTADITRMKGTGTWTVQSALELLVPIPTIAAAVFSREMSQDKDLRLKMSEKLTVEKGRYEGKRNALIDVAHDALYIAKISSYAQGMALLKAASKEYAFDLNLGNIAGGWRGGCIIRAQFLDEITRAYEENLEMPNLLAAPRFAKVANGSLGKLALLIEIAHSVGVPVPAMDSAYDYIVQLSSPVMVSAQVSAQQRDYFGAHGYFKIGGLDDPRTMTTSDGKIREFHTEWTLPERPEREITK